MNDPDRLEHNGLLLHAATRTVTLHGSEIGLTRTEFDLLRTLMDGGRVVLTKTKLIRRLRSFDYDTPELSSPKPINEPSKCTSATSDARSATTPNAPSGSKPYGVSATA